jgi:hypothetical protein
VVSRTAAFRLLWSAKTPSTGFQRNVTLLHCYIMIVPVWSGVSLFFLNVIDFKGVQAGWHFG